MGSVPGALLGSFALSQFERMDAVQADATLQRLLGVTLVVAAGAGIVRALGVTWGAADDKRPGYPASIALGFAVGLLVGLTSIGAGSLLMAAFALMYAIPACRAVGTDVVHGAVLASVAALAHGMSGRIDGLMLGSLLVGSIPGVVIGGYFCARLPAMPIRLAVAGVLAISGIRLL
jgi:uncharacterized membrane protein YfcA